MVRVMCPGALDRFEKVLELRRAKPPRETVEWTTRIPHDLVKSLQARLIASLGSGRVPRCRIEVWAHGDDVADELAYCRGEAWPRDGRAQVIWLGRRGMRSLDESIRGLRCIQVLLADEQNVERTVAEVVFGIAAAILELFGSTHLDLEVLDNGSGRLVEWYGKFGMQVMKDVQSDSPTMGCSINLISQLAPVRWTELLIPSAFDVLAWLQSKLHCAVRPSPPRPGHWEWDVADPLGARAIAQVQNAGTTDCFTAEVWLHSQGRNEFGLCQGTFLGSELGSCQGTFSQRNRIFEVTWLGRSSKRPIHAEIRGLMTYPTATAGTAPELSLVTSAIAMLGALVVLVQWFGIDTVRMCILGSRTGQLMKYMQGCGFAEVQGEACDHGLAELTQHTADDHVWISASCETVAAKCCPFDWYKHLPPDKDPT